MADEQNPKIAGLVDYLMAQVEKVADGGDWKEADGWLGRWIIGGPGGIVKVYEIKDGKFNALDPRTQKKFTGEVEMSEDTFLDLIDAALHGKGEDAFAQKYAKRHIRYKGAQWVVDSERFRKVLKRLANAPIRSIL